MSTYESEYEGEYFNGPYADLPPKQRRELLALAGGPDRIKQWFNDVSDYLEAYGWTAEVCEQARIVLGMSRELFDGLLRYCEEDRVQSLLSNLRAQEAHVKRLRSALRAYLDKPGET